MNFILDNFVIFIAVLYFLIAILLFISVLNLSLAFTVYFFRLGNPVFIFEPYGYYFVSVNALKK